MKKFLLIASMLASGNAYAAGYNSYTIVTTSVPITSTAMVNMLTPNRLELFNNATTGTLWINTQPVNGQTACAPAVVGTGLPIAPGGAGYVTQKKNEILVVLSHTTPLRLLEFRSH